MNASWHIFNWKASFEKAAPGEGMCMNFILIASILLLLAGGISLLLGYFTRVGVSFLLAELIMTSFIFHNFWDYTGNEMYVSFHLFMTKMAIGGGLLFLFSNGPGRMSIDARKEHRKQSHVVSQPVSSPSSLEIMEK